MLYVFNILPGIMLNFEINVALESVLKLKEEIQAKCNIPIQKQVLLCNGGIVLDNDLRVCNYNRDGIGTDSTPIYLFNLLSLENPLPSQAPTLTSQQSSPNQQLLSTSPLSNYQFPSQLVLSNAPSAQFILSLHSQQQQDEQQINRMKNKVADSLTLSASYSTIVARTEISKQIRDLTTQQLVTCEQLIRDQHFQYQGWCCVIANLDDIGLLFDTNVEKTLKFYQTFLQNKDNYNKLLSKLNIDIQILNMIPVLDVFNETDLFNETEDELRKAEIENLDEPDTTITSSQTSTKPNTTLLDWIHSKENRFTLNNLIKTCLIAMEHFDEQCFEELTKRIDDLKINLKNEENKKIKKIEDRLYQLDELIVKAKKYSNDTNGLTQAFIQNQNSASNVRDDSIFADLCHSHQAQLKIILQNLVDLNEIKNRYLRAKHELIYNLHSKLKTIILLEGDLSALNSTLIICAENLRKLFKNLQVLQQVHLTPKVYFLSINEILRRNLFTKKFGTWSNALHSKCNEIYEKETNLRNKFQEQVSNHFLTTLFSGLNDDFPQFFLPQLPEFDENLIEISTTDLNKLKEVLPKLKEFVDQLDNKDYIEYVDELKINEELLNENLVFEMICLNCFKNKQLDDEDDESRQSRQTNQSESTDFEKIFHELDLMNLGEKSNDSEEGTNQMLKKQESAELAAEAVENLIVENESDVVDLFKRDVDHDNKKNNIVLLKQKIEQKLIEREIELRKQFDKDMDQMRQNFAEQMKQLENRLKTEHKMEVETIRSRFKLACALDRSQMESSVKYSHGPFKSTKEE